MLLAANVLLAACGDDQDPAGAAALWSRIHAENYRGWARAPGYEQRRSSSAAHGDAVDIYINETVSDALRSPSGATAWPAGSLIVKDGFDGGDFELVAAMEKRTDGWFWVEWDSDGDASYSGKPSTCIDCHASGSDFVRAFALPK
jgi:Cytochrome P460